MRKDKIEFTPERHALFYVTREKERITFSVDPLVIEGIATFSLLRPDWIVKGPNFTNEDVLGGLVMNFFLGDEVFIKTCRGESALLMLEKYATSSVPLKIKAPCEYKIGRREYCCPVNQGEIR